MTDMLFEDYSSTYEALSIIYETLESDTETFKSFVTSLYLMESKASDDIVMESVSDVFKTIVTGIKKFIQAIKDFFKKVLLYITSAFQDLDKLAAEVDKVIKDKTIKFKIDGYKFTVVDKHGPNISEFQRIVSEYNNDITNLSELKEAEIKQTITDWLDETNLDKLRAEVLGVKDSIPEDEFLTEVRKFYRNDSDETSSIEVDNSYVRTIISGAKRLEDAKKASIKDRDSLISLLSRTEAFFDKTLQSFYQGSTRKVHADKISVDNNKLKTEKNTVTATDEVSKIVSMYATFKSKQVNKIGAMINTVASEKVNALKDQIKQERVILRKCLFGGTNDADKKDDKLTESTLGGKDYSIIAMESDIKMHPMYSQGTTKALLEETRFILKSIEDGQIYIVSEADTAKVGGKIKQTISGIIEMVVKAFRQKALESDEFNKAWIADITKPENKLEEKAKAKTNFTMANFFAVNDSMRNTMIRNLKSAISKAYGSKNYDDVSWAATILPSIKTTEDVRDTNTRQMLLNYYRTGKADAELDKKSMNGDELAKNLKIMTDYILNYADKISKPTEELSNAMKNASNAFKVTESWTPSTYLTLLDCTVAESDVILCRDFDKVFGVMEAEEDKAVKNATNAVKTETKVGNDAANAAKGENQSATSVTSEEDPQKTAELKKETNGPGEKTNNKAVTYKKMIDGFFKNCITLYLKAREEQYIAFKRALSDIDGAAPKKDKNGKYIPKADRQKDKEDSNEATKTESEETK